MWSKRFGKLGGKLIEISFLKNLFKKLGEEIRWNNCVEHLLDKLCEKKIMEKLGKKLGEKLYGKIVLNNGVEKYIKLG